MPKSVEEAIIALNEKIDTLIHAVKDIETKQLQLQQIGDTRYAVIMHQFSKIQNFHEIADMSNQVFEKRLRYIEKAIYDVKK